MDQDLVRGARDGDEEAFTRLADACVDRLLKVAHGIMRDPQLAEDATQQALLLIWRRLPSLRDVDRFEAWSYRLVVNACNSELRRSRGWLSHLSVSSVPEPRMPDAIAAIADRDELELAFKGLSLKHRAVVILHHYLGLTLAETADALGIREGTARSRLYYAMRQLRATRRTALPLPADQATGSEVRR